MSLRYKIARCAGRWLIGLGLRAPYFDGRIKLNSLYARLTNYQFEKTLDLGSGPTPRNCFSAKLEYGVDIRSYDQENSRVRKCNLSTDPLPFPESYFDCVTAFDVLEHIPRVHIIRGEQNFPFVKLMNEIWRVLRKDGYFFSVTPCFPMKQSFQDPTHVNIMTEDTLRLYFCEKAWARIYGYEGSFALVEEGWKRSHYWCLMKKTSTDKIIDRDSPQRL